MAMNIVEHIIVLGHPCIVVAIRSGEITVIPVDGKNGRVPPISCRFSEQTRELVITSTSKKDNPGITTPIALRDIVVQLRSVRAEHRGQIAVGIEWEPGRSYIHSEGCTLITRKTSAISIRPGWILPTAPLTARAFAESTITIHTALLHILHTIASAASSIILDVHSLGTLFTATCAHAASTIVVGSMRPCIFSPVSSCLLVHPERIIFHSDTGRIPDPPTHASYTPPPILSEQDLPAELNFHGAPSDGPPKHATDVFGIPISSAKRTRMF